MRLVFMTDGKDNERIESLRKKLEAAKTALAAENVKKQKREAKERRKQAVIIGEAMVREAEKFPAFREKFNGALSQIVTDEKERRLLEKQGWRL